MISKFFIERPVLANVIAILMVVIGAVSVLRLPVAQYPNVVPPTVQVTARYPGATARTVIDTVALPIEQQVNGVEDMLYMQSYATSDGTYALTVTFQINQIVSGVVINLLALGLTGFLRSQVIVPSGFSTVQRTPSTERL